VITTYGAMVADLKAHEGTEVGRRYFKPHGGTEVVKRSKGKGARERGARGEGLFGRRWRRVVLDEGHIIRNSKTKLSIAASSLDAVCRWSLTGTSLIPCFIFPWPCLLYHTTSALLTHIRNAYTVWLCRLTNFFLVVFILSSPGNCKVLSNTCRHTNNQHPRRPILPTPFPAFHRRFRRTRNFHQTHNKASENGRSRRLRETPITHGGDLSSSTQGYGFWGEEYR